MSGMSAESTVTFSVSPSAIFMAAFLKTLRSIVRGLPDTCFTCVIADDVVNGVFRNVAIIGFQSVFFTLPPDQVAQGDLRFFLLGVTGQLDHFKTVAQGPWNRVRIVGGTDEHDFSTGRKEPRDSYRGRCCSGQDRALRARRAEGSP